MKNVDYESLFKTSPQPSVVMSTDLTVLDANDAYLNSNNVSREDVVGKSVLDSLPENDDANDSVQRLKTSLEDAINTQAATPLFVETEGQTLVVAPQIIMDPAQEIEKYRIAAVHKDEFLSLLAHELRNPLSSINAATEILTMGHPDPARLQKMTNVMKRQINLLAGLIDNLSDVSHLSRGLSDDKLALDLKHIVAEAVEQNSAFIKAREHNLTLDLPNEDIKITGDHKRIMQALTSLLTNAAKYTPNGGNISVQLSTLGEQVIIAVSDDGIGISQELLPHVFELFANGSKAADHSQRGLGIGLAVVKSIVESHGGSVSVCSNKHAKGSRFEIYLPRLLSK